MEFFKNYINNTPLMVCHFGFLPILALRVQPLQSYHRQEKISCVNVPEFASAPPSGGEGGIASGREGGRTDQ